MQIVTGYRGESHITSNDVQGFNQGVVGEDSYVLSVGNQFEITAVSANEFQIADGEGVHQGVHFRVDPGTYDTVTIDSGTQDMWRTDLICARFGRNQYGVENMSWYVIKGEETASITPIVPHYVHGDILNGSNTADFPMFKIRLDGVNIDSVTAMFTVLPHMQLLNNRQVTLRSDVDDLQPEAGALTYSSGYSSMSDAPLTMTRFGHLAVLNGNVSVSSGSMASGWNTIFTLPAECYPYMLSTVDCVIYGSSNAYIATARAAINTGGSVTVFCSSALSNVVRISFNVVYHTVH